MHHSLLLSPIITFKFSSLNIICYGQKDPIYVRLFKLLSPHAIVESTRSKSIQTLHQYLKDNSLMKDNSSVPFLAQTLYTTKVTHQSADFQTYVVF